MASALTLVGEAVTASGTWISTVVTTIQENPLLLLFAVIPLVGLGIGLVRRLINL